MSIPTFPIRECYCPAHFGNAYEAMWPREMAAYLGEMKWWGFNRYGDWITTTDCCDPYMTAGHWMLAVELLERKRRAFLAAQHLVVVRFLVHPDTQALVLDRLTRPIQ